jgi:DNA-directed RNA polymerase subunit L
MSKEEVWFDEDRQEIVVELDGDNEFLNNLLREALEKHDNAYD